MVCYSDCLRISVTARLEMTGVYRITSVVSDCVYIGSSTNIKKRLQSHRDRLIKGIHENRHLQRAWDKYGNDGFLFESLIECGVEDRKIREQKFIDAYVGFGLPVYNMRPSADSRECFGYKHSEETKRKISAGITGRSVSKETRDKIRAGRLGCRASEEVRAKQRSARFAYLARVRGSVVCG